MHRTLKKIYICFIMILFSICDTFIAFGEEDSRDIIYNYCDYINSGDYVAYAELFAGKTRNDIINSIGKVKFREKELSVSKIVQIDEEVYINMSSRGENKTLAEYEDVYVYYVHLIGQFDGDKTDDDKMFYIVKEEGRYKILFLPNIEVALLQNYCKEYNNTEPFDTEKPSTVTSTNTLTCPTSITIRLDDTANRTYYGGRDSVTIGFHQYLKNVIPNEWYVSYYSLYPDYLRAGAMASKMYAWYHTINKRYYYHPYYADVNDDENTQVYKYNAYSSLATIYKSYVDYTMSYINGIALLTSTNTLFETLYSSNSGSQGSGKINAAQMWMLAQSGYSTQQLLKYYYDYSSATSGQTVAMTTCYEATY